MIVSLVKMNSPNMERTIVEGAQSAGTVVEKVDGLSKDSLRATVAAGRGIPGSRLLRNWRLFNGRVSFWRRRLPRRLLPGPYRLTFPT